MKGHSRLTSLPPFYRWSWGSDRLSDCCFPSYLEAELVFEIVFSDTQTNALSNSPCCFLSQVHVIHALYIGPVLRLPRPDIQRTGNVLPVVQTHTFPRWRFSHHGHRDEWGHGSAPVRRAPVLAPTPPASVSLLSSWQALISVWLPSLCDLST